MDTPAATTTRHALEREFIANWSTLVEVATRTLGGRRFAEDVVQDAFLKLWTLTSAEDVRQPAGYLVRMVRNQAVDKRRRMILESRHMLEGEDIALACESGDCPETRAMSRQELGILGDALAQLPERTCTAFCLHRLEGRSQKDIAAQFGVSPTLVNIMIHKAQSHCQAALAGKAPGQRRAALSAGRPRASADDRR